LRGDSLTDDEQAKAERSTGSAVAAASVAFFLAELGDKTMLTTAGLAADRGAGAVWIGSFAAMLAATALAVLAGAALVRRVAPSLLRRIGAVAFAVVGVLTIAGAAAG
jgi:putative Ca2+/H+ antiporter (TMEM165/GDT1 family)